MQHPVSKIPTGLNQALMELTQLREELRGAGYRKATAIQTINERVIELVPNHTGSTPARVAHLIEQRSLSVTREMLRT